MSCQSQECWITRAVLLCALLPLVTIPLFAKPPGSQGGGKGGGDTPAGTVFAWVGGSDGSLVAMDASGANATSLPANVYWEPSDALHNNQPWFLHVAPVGNEAYPDGDQRHELFAVSADGQNSVQLTSQANLEPFGPRRDSFDTLRWTVDGEIADGRVSWSAVCWDDVTGQPIGAGIYSALVDFDADGNIVGLLAQPDPLAPLAELAIHAPDSDGNGIPESISPLHGGHDWDSTGTRLVYSNGDQDDFEGLWIWDAATDTSHFVTQGGYDPAWSPIGEHIAFAAEGSSLFTINSDGSSEQLILSQSSGNTRATDYSQPTWSPDGTHLLCHKVVFNRKNGTVSSSVVRLLSDGSGANEINEGVPVGWR